jgi:hypothetical protein
MAERFFRLTEGVWIAGLPLFLFVSTGFSAAEYTEEFDTDESGWTTSSPFGLPLTYVGADQNIQVTLNQFSGGFPDPTKYLLQANTNASGGAFSGDFTAAGVNYISVDFMAEDIIPSELILRISSGQSGTYFVNLTSRIPAVGEWVHFAIDITSQSAGFWFGGTDPYLDVVTNVVSVAFLLVENNTGTQRFRFDNIALERIPVATDLQITASNEAVITWDYLTPAASYTVEAAASPLHAWTDIGSFTPTGSVTNFTDSAASTLQRRVYRLLR